MRAHVCAPVGYDIDYGVEAAVAAAAAAQSTIACTAAQPVCVVGQPPQPAAATPLSQGMRHVRTLSHSDCVFIYRALCVYVMYSSVAAQMHIRLVSLTYLYTHTLQCSGTHIAND